MSAARVTEYTIDVIPDGHAMYRYSDIGVYRVVIADRETDVEQRWAVYRYTSAGGLCLNLKTGEWDIEPLPGSRDAEWFRDHRGTFEVVEQHAIRAARVMLDDLETRERLRQLK